ncbi:MAG TPA: M20/M25/M40 family metallo-hydrolase, partial [Polyangiaceae bacterium]|nr:M20/M25/M40 family metallo-hydrolase [Polyangiaceae bacterium]
WPKTPGARTVAAALVLTACAGEHGEGAAPTVSKTIAGVAVPAPTGPAAAAPEASSAADPAPLDPIAAPYRDAAAHIARASLEADGTWERLTILTDVIGARMTGTPELERAVAWARDAFVHDDQEGVAVEPVRVPRWVRGDGSGEIVGSSPRRFSVLALGGSVGTPRGGITAELIVVRSFEELEQARDRVKGKVVLFDHPMALAGDPSLSYGAAVAFRNAGAMRAAPLGAKAVLVRSVTAVSLGSPHTGHTRYREGKGERIPAASVTLEDAELLARIAKREDSVKVKLAIGAKTVGEATSGNVVAELRGSELPNEIVVIGAHLDSWDVGQGAQDDGAGTVIVMESLATLRRLGLRPRRTIRAVLFTAEEMGGLGAKQYVVAHKDELERHVAAFEVDTGAGAPLGFMTDGAPCWAPEARVLARLLAPIGAGSVDPGYPGTDVLFLKPAKTALLGLKQDISHYFDVHHSAADTLEKIAPDNLRRGVAALATMAYVVADRPSTWRCPEPAVKGGT